MMQPMDPVVRQNIAGAGQLNLRTVDIHTPRLGPNVSREEAERNRKPPCLRTIFEYIPKSGCYAAVQTPTLVVLREGADRESAEETAHQLGLFQFCEEHHTVLLMPNCTENGWMGAKTAEDVLFLEAMQRLVSQGRDVGGHSSLSYFVGVDGGCAMAFSFAAWKPACVTSLLLVHPGEVSVPEDATHAPVTAWVYGAGKPLAAYLLEASKAILQEKRADGTLFYQNPGRPAIRLLLSEKATDMQNVLEGAWREIFGDVRRWQNNELTYGTYEERIDFAACGFIAHEKDESLGLTDGYEHNWYEHCPSARWKDGGKRPLLVCLHGGSCVPLYYAEQNRWHVLGEKYGFYSVYPEAGTKGHWNFGFDPEEPDDEGFILAIIRRMKETYPIDPERIYIAGFSNGAMMTHSMAAIHPELFAAAAASNAFFDHLFPEFKILPSYHRERFTLAQRIREKKAEKDYKMPLIQTAATQDLIGGAWPIDSDAHSRARAMNFWKDYNGIPHAPIPTPPATLVGSPADTVEICDTHSLFGWHAPQTEQPLYEFLVVNHLTHAVWLGAVELAWRFMKNFARASDGALKTIEGKEE